MGKRGFTVNGVHGKKRKEATPDFLCEDWQARAATQAEQQTNL